MAIGDQTSSKERRAVEEGLARHRAEVDARLAREVHDKRIALASAMLLPLVQGGERWAALKLMFICAGAVKDGCAVSGVVGKWLTGVLKALSGGDSFEEAAGIPKRKRSAKKERAASAARGRRYFIAHQYGVRHKHEGMKKIAARLEVAELFNVKPDTVDSAWKHYRRQVMRALELEVDDLGKVFKITSPPKLDDN